MSLTHFTKSRGKFWNPTTHVQYVVTYKILFVSWPHANAISKTNSFSSIKKWVGKLVDDGTEIIIVTSMLHWTYLQGAMKTNEMVCDDQ